MIKRTRGTEMCLGASLLLLTVEHTHASTPAILSSLLLQYAYVLNRLKRNFKHNGGLFFGENIRKLLWGEWRKKRKFLILEKLCETFWNSYCVVNYSRNYDNDYYFTRCSYIVVKTKVASWLQCFNICSTNRKIVSFA